MIGNIDIYARLCGYERHKQELMSCSASVRQGTRQCRLHEGSEGFDNNPSRIHRHLLSNFAKGKFTETDNTAVVEYWSNTARKGPRLSRTKVSRIAEIAELALRVLGVAGLFTSCIENFDIVVRAREFSEEFELLCTQLALQQIRLIIWGETLGLIPPPNGGRRKPYNRALDRPDIRPAIETTLNQLQSLLDKADAITGRYTSEEQERAARSSETRAITDSKGMTIFRDSYQRFKARVKKNQKDKSIWKVTRWSIHDYEKFEHLVTSIRDLVNALESITGALGMLAQQQSLLINEIESLSDTASLSLLQQIGSSGSAPTALRAVSDTASARLTYVTSSSRSYYTARTDQSQGGTYNHHQVMLTKAQAVGNFQSQYEANVQTNEGVKDHNHATPATTNTGNTATDVPQNQRWMAALLSGKVVDAVTGPVFSTKDTEYGRVLKSSRDYDCNVCRDHSAKLAVQAHEGLPLARRMFLELRNIRRADVPFISAAPIGDKLDKLLASIEGPPGTPYAGGIFWITVKVVESKPPMLSFHTRIYHPNIDPSGKVCADYATWWQEANLLNGLGNETNLRSLPWFSEHINNHYSLGALLIALCGLLASPNNDDPLVPEIAEKYITDHNAYYEAAKLYTERFAYAGRPDDTELVFPEEDNKAGTGIGAAEYREKRVTESLMPRRVVSNSTIIWERISSYQLDWSKLEEHLSKLFPEMGFVHHKSAINQYCVALLKQLSDAQRQEIHTLRGEFIEDDYPNSDEEYSPHSDEEYSPHSDEDE
ncbi:prion-inhibition and propagation-domain-containing protein [Jackrogersella minutella]|nr:prion-inhibition and propagation-domain-containing protein [Jackrogersella minutella]